MCYHAALSIRFVNDTPILVVDRVYAEIEISRPGVTMECHLTHQDGSRTDCKCSIISEPHSIIIFLMPIFISGA